MKSGYVVLQVILLLLMAPLVEGIIRKTKAFWQNREGPGLFQSYYNLFKYFRKDSVKSENASWLYTIAPYMTFASITATALFIPSILPGLSLDFAGDIILVFYLFALARFFMVLAGLDTGSAFGGMGSSREMFISSLVEPVMFLAFFSVILNVNSTDISVMTQSYTTNWFSILRPSHLLALTAIFIVFIAETGRIPVDNPDTHLELTMVHEGMLLEYSGKPLALMTLSAMVKQVLVLSLIANVFFPGVSLPTFNNSALGMVFGSLLYAFKILFLALITATFETVNNKLRLFRVPGLLATAFILAGLSVGVQLLIGG